MIEKITVINPQGERLVIDLWDPVSGGFFLTNAAGMDAPAATVNTTDLALSDIGLFNSSKVQARAITLQFRLVEYLGVTLEEIRHRCYRFFQPGKKVRLEVETDRRTSFCEGYVERNGVSIFGTNEDVTVAILCPDPFFYGITDQITGFSGVTPAFEFPFSNEDLEDPMIELSIQESRSRQVIFYDGEAAVGITMTIHCLASVGTITLYDIKSGKTLILDSDRIAAIAGDGLQASDDVVIRTEKGLKSVTLIRDGEETSLLNAIGRDASWFTLEPGDNVFAFTATSGETDIQFTVQNRVRYLGV